MTNVFIDEQTAMTASLTEEEKTALAVQVFHHAHEWYDATGNHDSIDREQAFHCFALVFGVDYDIAYNAWLTETKIEFKEIAEYGA